MQETLQLTSFCFQHRIHSETANTLRNALRTMVLQGAHIFHYKVNCTRLCACLYFTSGSYLHFARNNISCEKLKVSIYVTDRGGIQTNIFEIQDHLSRLVCRVNYCQYCTWWLVLCHNMNSANTKLVSMLQNVSCIWDEVDVAKGGTAVAELTAKLRLAVR
jgi:hypothetical protein